MNRSLEMNILQTDTKPNGPVVAAFLAAGVASLVLGIGVVLNEASAGIKNAMGVDFSAFLAFDKNFGIGSGVGALSGKVSLAVIAFVASWIVFHLWLRGKEVNFRTYFIAALVLVGLGFALTFPPVFLLFAPAE
jgi:glycerol-3-phosphate acyltransferase PlsY